jgi:hypothetical protein
MEDQVKQDQTQIEEAEAQVNTAKNPLYNINILKHYIRALTVNVKPDPLPRELNLIFDSGAVNGLLGIGSALYLLHLEELNYIKINKISGCSVGSLIAVWYICGCPDSMYNEIETLFAHYKTHKNFFIFKDIVSKVIQELFPLEKDIERLNGFLCINYYDTKERKQCVVSNFKDRAHLTRCILRSSHVPFITNPCHKLEDRYVDGIAPYIFQEDKQGNSKNLFIQLIKFTSPLKTMNIKKDKNIYSRLIKGMVDTNEFFINGSSSICSYVNWQTKIILYVRKKFVYWFLFLIDLILLLRNSIPSSLKETYLYRKLVSLCRLLWDQLFKQLT